MVVKLRLFYNRVCIEKNRTWDEELSEELKEEWTQIYRELHKVKNCEFPRSLIPPQVKVKSPPCSLIIFVDGSLIAYAAAAYLRFEGRDWIVANLLTSLVKIAGTRRITAPKSELLAAELGVKLANQIAIETEGNIKIEQTYFFTDSKILLAQLEMDPTRLDLFTGSRTQFILDNTNKADWWWIPSGANPADLATRSRAKVEEVQSAFWLNGGFILDPQTCWPSRRLHQEEVMENLPNTEELLTAQMLVKSLELKKPARDDTLLNLTKRHRSLKKVLNVLKRCLSWRFRNHSEIDLEIKAKNLLIESSYQDSKEIVKRRQFFNGIIEEEGRRYYLKMRNFENYNQNKLIIISPSSYFGQLLIKDGHDCYGHLNSVRVVQAKLQQQGFYIPFSAKSIAKEKKNCPLCKKLLANPAVQKMGDMKRHRFQTAKPFTSIFVDLAGPFRAFDSIKRRTTGKVWCLVVSCTYTRAVSLFALENQSADAVVNALDRHKSRYGQFLQVFSDLGTNLVAAGKLSKPSEVVDEEETLGGEDLKKIFRGVVWNHGVPRAPWIVGGAESIVKMLKKQLKVLRIQEGHKKLSPLEYETLFQRIANTINNRPIVMASEPGRSLSPNDLLFGYNQQPVDQEGPQESRLTVRHAAIQASLKTWWKIYHSDFLKKAGNLSKWKTETPNLKVGDICLLLDSPNDVGSYRLGRVVEVFPDERNLVRKVAVEYSLTSGQKNIVQRSIRTLSKLESEEDFGNNTKTEDLEADAEDEDDEHASVGYSSDSDDLEGNVGEEDMDTSTLPAKTKLRIQVQYPENIEVMKDLKLKGQGRLRK